MWGYLIKYSDFYNDSVPENPIELIVNIPKEELIVTIVAINTRLKPIGSSHYDDSRQTQIDCLRTVFLDNNNPIHFSICSNLIHKYNDRPRNQNLFSRVTCLYSLQEILNYNEFADIDPQYTFENREQIFKFLLISNDRILTGDKHYREEGYDELGKDFFEFFMFRELHHNQYNNSSNAINIFYKSYFLFNAIEQSPLYGQHFKNYLTWYYNVESTDDFLKHVMWTFLKSYDEQLNARYINISKENVEPIKILDSFSSVVNYDLPLNDDLRKFDFYQIKKSPLFKSSEKDGKNISSYFVMDESFYIEKCYSLFINDFWFDYLLQNEVCTRKDWGGFIGTVFFEKFIGEILHEASSTSPDMVLRSTNQLLFNIEGRPIEYADFYLREKQNIALFEVKSGFIPLDHGYKTVKNIADYRNLDLDKFNKDYGLTQLAEKTIKKFHIYKKEIEDKGLNLNRKVQIYPVVVVNDPIISSGIVTFVLKRKFRDLLAKEGIDVKCKHHNIKDLCIMNVSHLQEMEQNLKDRKINFFNILDQYLMQSDFTNKANFKNYNFLRTFDHVLNLKVKEGLIADRIKEMHWLKK